MVDKASVFFGKLAIENMFAGLYLFADFRKTGGRFGENGATERSEILISSG